MILIITVREALRRMLLFDGDYAEELNDVGFNQLDTSFAHDIARYPVWTEKQQQSIYRVLKKYRRQLASYGINYDELVFEKTYEKERMKNILYFNDDKTKIYLKIDYKLLNFAKSIGKYPSREWNSELKVWMFNILDVGIMGDLRDAIVTLKDDITITEEVSNLFYQLNDAIQIHRDAIKEKNKAQEKINENKNDNLILVEYIKKEKELPNIPLPPINATLYDHQKRAFMISYILPASALLMEQGTGKTLSAITTISKLYIEGKINKLLIVAPLSVLDVWVEQFEEFATIPYNIQIVKGTIGYKRNVFNIENIKDNCLNICVVNYDAIAARKIKKRDEHGNVIYIIKNGKRNPVYIESGGIYDAISSWLHEDIGKSMILLDESQRIKNKSTDRSNIIHKFGDIVSYKMILTGTPITQSPMDLWSQYRFLDKSIFGTSFYKFRSEYAVLGGFQDKEIIGYKNLDKLIEKAHSIGYRVTKDDALDLPDFVDQHLYVTLKDSSHYYNDMSKKARIILTDAENNKNQSSEIKANLAITQILKLAQITGGFIKKEIKDDKGKIIEHKYIQIGDEKLKALKEFVEDYPINKKLVIVCRFIPEVTAISNVVKSLGRTCDVIYGDTKNRGEIINNFQKTDNPNVLVIQIQTAGLGITLTRADTMLFYSYGYSYADMEQARARVHRFGQKNNVTYIYLVCKDTIDEIILDAITKKGKIANIIVDKTIDKTIIEAISEREEIANMVIEYLKQNNN